MSTCVFYSDEYLDEGDWSPLLAAYRVLPDATLWYTGRRTAATGVDAFRTHGRGTVAPVVEPRWADLPLAQAIAEYLGDAGFTRAVFIGCPALAYRTCQARRMGLIAGSLVVEVADDGYGSLRQRRQRFPSAPTDLITAYMEDYVLRHAEPRRSPPGAEAVRVASTTPAPGREAQGLTVAAVMAVHNDADNLRLSLASLTDQPRDELHEIVVVDDGSDPAQLAETRAIVAAKADPRVRLLCESPNRGAGVARNRGLAAAHSDLCVFFDSDNLAMTGMFGALRAAWCRSGADLVLAASERIAGSRAERLLDGHGATVAIPAGPVRALGFLWNVYGDVVFIGRRERILACGPFTDRLVEDWEFVARAGLQGLDIDVLPRPVYRYLVKPEKHAFRQERRWQKAAKMIALHREMVAHNTDLVPTWLELIQGQYEAAAGRRQDTATGSLYTRLARLDERVLLDFLRPDGGPAAGAEWAAVDRLHRHRHLWEDDGRTLYLYGAGEHSKFLLALCPWLYAHIEAFIDRNGGNGRRFLDRPVIAPHEYRPDERHVIVYSSREHEDTMQRSLASDKPLHLRLYTADAVSVPTRRPNPGGARHA